MIAEYHRLILIFVDWVGLAPASSASPLAVGPLAARVERIDSIPGGGAGGGFHNISSFVLLTSVLHSRAKDECPESIP